MTRFSLKAPKLQHGSRRPAFASRMSAFRLGGGSALYEASPLQRRMRDLHAAAQHAAVHQRNYGNAGKLLLGSSPQNVEIRSPA